MDHESQRADVPPLEIVPLGGLGEFGMNMMVIACGESAILVDAGAGLRSAGIDPSRRPETLQLDELARLAEFFAPS